MKKEKQSEQKDIDRIFAEIKRKLFSVENEIRDLNAKKIPRDTSSMMVGPAPIFDTKEKAEEVMKNPDVLLAIQHVNDIIKRNINR